MDEASGIDNFINSKAQRRAAGLPRGRGLAKMEAAAKQNPWRVEVRLRRDEEGAKGGEAAAR